MEYSDCGFSRIYIGFDEVAQIEFVLFTGRVVCCLQFAPERY